MSINPSYRDSKHIFNDINYDQNFKLLKFHRRNSNSSQFGLHHHLVDQFRRSRYHRSSKSPSRHPSSQSQSLRHYNPYPLEVYHLRRTLHGVPEGPEEIIEGSALPAESNLDVMSGIDFTKGCYVGQELTSRTYHTGIIRKRLLPLSLYPAGGQVQEPMTLAYNASLSMTLPPSGTAMAAEGEKRSPGKFLRGWGNVGWGLCRLDYVGRVLECEWDGGTILAKPFLPKWADKENDPGSVGQ